MPTACKVQRMEALVDTGAMVVVLGQDQAEELGVRQMELIPYKIMI